MTPDEAKDNPDETLQQSVAKSDRSDEAVELEALQESTHKLADAVYAQASAQAASQAGGNGGSSTEDEVVEEAEYEVVDEDEAAKRS